MTLLHILPLLEGLGNYKYPWCTNITWLAGAVEYIVCFSAEGWDSPNKCPGYDTKQSDGKVSVMLELWGMQSIPSLPSLPGPLWPGVVAPDRVLSTGQIELNCVLVLNRIVWDGTVLTFKLRTCTKLNVNKKLYEY